ncbi:MAG: hypothetical protein HUJ91_07755 [Bacteroidales bacterium]|nr:hypothetical protein [Bacteroidales bacterium]
MKKIILSLVAILTMAVAAEGRRYNGSLFSMRSDGTTDNTSSLQFAIDYISANSPGDTLEIWVGRYPIGGVRLKSNVTIYLREGAILTGIRNAYNYDLTNATPAMLYGEDIENFEIFGQGVIEGFGTELGQHIDKQVSLGYINSAEAASPWQVALKGCRNVTLKGIVMQNGCRGGLNVTECSNLTLDNVTIFGRTDAPTEGIVASKNNGLHAVKCYIDVKGNPVVSTSNENSVADGCIIPDGTFIKL